MPFYFPAPAPNPWVSTFADYMRHRQEQELWKAGQPKESGASLSASGAAGGAASGAAIGTSILPGIGTLIGAGIGAGTGAVVGKYTNPRMHSGEGPYAQPGNIAQDNAAIMQGIMATAGQVAGAFKKAKDEKERSKWVDQYFNYVFGDTSPVSGGTAQQSLAALDAFVGELPADAREDVSGYYQQRIAQSPEMLGGYSPPQPMGMRPMDGVRGGAMPAMPVGGGAALPADITQIRARSTPGAPAANIADIYRANQQANSIFQQTSEAGLMREYSPRAKEAIKRLDDVVDDIMTNPTWRPADKVRALEMATQARARIRKRASVAPRPPTWEQMMASGQVKQLGPQAYAVWNPKSQMYEKLEYRAPDDIDPMFKLYPPGSPQGIGSTWMAPPPSGDPDLLPVMMKRNEKGIPEVLYDPNKTKKDKQYEPIRTIDDLSLQQQSVLANLVFKEWELNKAEEGGMVPPMPDGYLQKRMQEILDMRTMTPEQLRNIEASIPVAEAETTHQMPEWLRKAWLATTPAGMFYPSLKRAFGGTPAPPQQPATAGPVAPVQPAQPAPPSMTREQAITELQALISAIGDRQPTQAQLARIRELKALLQS